MQQSLWDVVHLTSVFLQHINSCHSKNRGWPRPRTMRNQGGRTFFSGLWTLGATPCLQIALFYNLLSVVKRHLKHSITIPKFEYVQKRWQALVIYVHRRIQQLMLPSSRVKSACSWHFTSAFFVGFQWTLRFCE